MINDDLVPVTRLPPKDHFVEATAYELGLPILKLTPADFFRGIVGQSESEVKKKFDLIESLGKVIVYIPESLS
jgi:hypothetical protein